jgi:hypothetical protein
MAAQIGREIPNNITRVEGCSCGGMEMHTITCTIHDMKSEDVRRNIDAAIDRVLAYTEGLNTGRRLAEMERDRIDGIGYDSRTNRMRHGQ